MSDFCKHDVHLTIDCSACRKNICEKREDYNHIQSLKTQIEILEKACLMYKSQGGADFITSDRKMGNCILVALEELEKMRKGNNDS